MLKHIPNALTLARLILAPVIAWCMWRAYDLKPLDVDGLILAAAGLFVVAALTDLFDGMAARAFNAHSKFGRLIDPIADKALVGLPLIVLAYEVWATNAPLWWIVAVATSVIVVRDVWMTVIRLTAKDGEGARVSSLAKWKTALELVTIGVALLLPTIGVFARLAGDEFRWPDWVYYAWMALLVLAAALSAYTARQYLTPKRA